LAPSLWRVPLGSSTGEAISSPGGLKGAGRGDSTPERRAVMSALASRLLDEGEDVGDAFVGIGGRRASAEMQHIATRTSHSYGFPPAPF
jgi:hypothetical protein